MDSSSSKPAVIAETLAALMRAVLQPAFSLQDCAAEILRRSTALTGARLGVAVEIIEKTPEELGTFVAHLPQNVLRADYVDPALESVPRSWWQPMADCRTGLVENDRSKLRPASSPAAFAPTNALSIPVLWDTQRIGLIVLGDAPAGFSDEHREIVTSLAEVLAFAIRRKQTEQAFAVQDLRYRNLFDEAKTGITISYLAENAVYINPALVAMLGLSKGRLTLQESIALTHPDDVALEMPLFSELMAGKRSQYSLEKRYVRPDGSCFWATYRMSIVFDHNRQPLFSIGFVDDISELRRVRQEKESMERRYRQAEKLTAIGRLAGGVAHDFNNSLTAIIGSAEMLQLQTGGDPAQLAWINTILKTAVSAATLSRRLLTFARADVGRREPVDLNVIVGNIAFLLTATIDRKISVVQQLSPRPCLISGDRALLENALLNLGFNARDAMPDGGTLSLATESLDNGHVRLSVSDTGVGMTAEVKSHLFEPFFTTKAPDQGTGLGLASVFGVVRSHDGTIDVESEPGSGTTFSLRFPEIAPERTKQPLAPSAPEHGTGTIMLVEDEDAVRRTTRGILEKLGYSVLPFENGRAAVEHLREHAGNVDLVILDMDMPVLNGRDTYTAMRELKPDVKALFVSGFVTEQEFEELRRMKVSFVMQKPWAIQEFARNVKLAMQGASSA